MSFRGYLYNRCCAPRSRSIASRRRRTSWCGMMSVLFSTSFCSGCHVLSVTFSSYCHPSTSQPLAQQSWDAPPSSSLVRPSQRCCQPSRPSASCYPRVLSPRHALQLLARQVPSSWQPARLRFLLPTNAHKPDVAYKTDQSTPSFLLLCLSARH